MIYDRQGKPPTSQDLELIQARASDLTSLGIEGQDAGSGPTTSEDGTAALVAVPIRLGDADLAEEIDSLRRAAKADLPEGLRAQVTGAPAYEVDLSAVFDGANGTLLLTTAAVVALLLLGPAAGWEFSIGRRVPHSR